MADVFALIEPADLKVAFDVFYIVEEAVVKFKKS
jgi:hypothetical protein